MGLWLSQNLTLICLLRDINRYDMATPIQMQTHQPFKTRKHIITELTVALNQTAEKWWAILYSLSWQRKRIYRYMYCGPKNIRDQTAKRQDASHQPRTFFEFSVSLETVHVLLEIRVFMTELATAMLWNYPATTNLQPPKQPCGFYSVGTNILSGYKETRREKSHLKIPAWNLYLLIQNVTRQQRNTILANEIDFSPLWVFCLSCLFSDMSVWPTRWVLCRINDMG